MTDHHHADNDGVSASGHRNEEAAIFLYDGEEDVPRDVTHVKVDASLRMIYAQTFFVHSHLSYVDLPEGLKTIRRRAFFMCEALSYIRFPSTLEEIETCAFVGCVKLAQAQLPKGLKVLGSAAFAKCESLTHFQVPPLIQVIDVSLFSNCKDLYSVELPPTGIWRIRSRAFKNCHQLRNIVLPGSIQVVEGVPFSGCTCLLEALSIPYDDNDATDADHNHRVCQALKNRFESYPLHKLCYYQGYYDLEPTLFATTADDDFKDMPSSILEAVQELKHPQGGLPKLYLCEEISGMTPLHVLALSSRPSLELAKVIVKFGRKALCNQELQDSTPIHDISFPIREKDRWNRDPLMYASMNLTTESTAVTKFLLEALLSPMLTSLGLTRWRLEVTDDMDRLLYDSKTRSKRVQHMEQVLLKLNRFVQMERLSLLELTVWKASILATIRKDEQTIHSNGGENDNAENETTSDALSQHSGRAKCRTLCGAQIVLPHVLLFLGDP